MFILLLLIMAMFFSPYLLIPVFAFFALLVLLLPFQFTVNSLFHIFTIPGQIYKIATNRVLRMNHALEHATVNVLERKYGYKNLAGYAENNGFFIIGTNNIFQVEQAAREGLSLLKRGEKELAIHESVGPVFPWSIYLLFSLYFFNPCYRTFQYNECPAGCPLCQFAGSFAGKICPEVFYDLY